MEISNEERKLKSLICDLAFHRHIIPHFADIHRMLTQLTQKPSRVSLLSLKFFRLQLEATLYQVKGIQIPFTQTTGKWVNKVEKRFKRTIQF